MLMRRMKKNYPPQFYESYLESMGIQPTEEDILAKKDRIYWLRFEPTDQPTPETLAADLAWVWLATLGVLAGIMGIGLLKRRRSA